MLFNVFGDGHDVFGAALAEAQGVNHLHARGLAKANRLSASAGPGTATPGRSAGVAADAKIFDAERLEHRDERLVLRAEKIRPVRVRAKRIASQNSTRRNRPESWRQALLCQQ